VSPSRPSFPPQPRVYPQASDSCNARPPRSPFVFSRLRALFLSLRSFAHSHRLFSVACSLFSQITRGWGIPNEPTGHPCVNLCALCVSALSFPFCLSPLYFHDVTNPSPCNPFCCTSIQNPGGCTTPIGSVSPLVTRHFLLSTFRINTCKSASKQTTSSPFRINTCEKPGGTGSPPFLALATLFDFAFARRVHSQAVWLKSASGAAHGA
jgi:hypothetical protein